MVKRSQSITQCKWTKNKIKEINKKVNNFDHLRNKNCMAQHMF
jgi:hypothetical protein